MCDIFAELRSLGWPEDKVVSLERFCAAERDAERLSECYCAEDERAEGCRKLTEPAPTQEGARYKLGLEPAQSGSLSVEVILIIAVAMLAIGFALGVILYPDGW